MKTFDEFLDWEKSSADIIDFKKTYVDMANDLIAGLVLSELVYWYLPSKNGRKNKLRVFHDSELWIAVRYKDWWERARITKAQAERAVKVLVNKGILIKKVKKFNGEPTVHLRIVKETFLELHENAIKLQSNSGMTENETRFNGYPLTENTAENKTEDTTTRDCHALNSLAPQQKEYLNDFKSLDLTGQMTNEHIFHWLDCINSYGPNKTFAYLKWCEEELWSWDKAYHSDLKNYHIADWDTSNYYGYDYEDEDEDEEEDLDDE